jgi:hypothetical protein
MLVVKSGDTVVLRDGRTMYVTDAVDQGAPEVKTNPDNIIICVPARRASNGWIVGDNSVVINMTEVVSIIE